MVTRLKFLTDVTISYGPGGAQKVYAGQIIDIPDDGAAQQLIANGNATTDGVDPVTFNAAATATASLPSDLPFDNGKTQ